MENKIDIFDENYCKIGEASKSLAHKLGLWHRVFTCLIIDKSKETVYFQRKVRNRYTFDRPNYIDISVGGHYHAGEEIEDGVREFVEETGMQVTFSDLISLGIRRSVFSIDKSYYCCEYQHVFLYDLDGKEAAFAGDVSEISEFVEVKLMDFLDLLLQKKVTVPAMILGRQTQYEDKLSNSDIDPAFLEQDQFLLRLVIAAIRYVHGENIELLFW